MVELNMQKEEKLWRIEVDPKRLDEFTLPPFPKEEEVKLLKKYKKEQFRKHKRAFVVGRFQPLHYGHVLLMKQALQQAEGLVIGIGSSNIRNFDNPFSPQEREGMLVRMLKREKNIKHKVIKIVRIPDYPDDNFWLKESLRRIGKIDLVVGNNDWVNRIFKNANYSVMTTPLFDRVHYEGKKIRALLREEVKLREKIVASV